MKYPSISVTFNRLGYKSKSGTYPLYLRIYYKEKVDYVRLKDLPKITDEDWIGDASNGVFVRNFKINQKVNEILLASRDWAYEKVMNGHHVTLDMIKQHLVQPEVHKDFSSFAHHYIRNINKNKNEYEKLEYRTIQAYRSFLVKLNEYDNRIQYDQVNTRFLEDFDRWLATKHNLRSQTRRKHFEKLGTVYKAACKHGLMSYDPLLFNYKIKSNPNEKSLRVSLTVDEIRQLKMTVLENESDEFYKNIFLFGCLTGLYYSDIQGLQTVNIRKQIITENGHKKEVEFIEGSRYKNGEKYVIPVFVDTRSILENHAEVNSASMTKDSLLFPNLISSQKYNQKLKKIANVVGIEKNLSAIVARHSFAEMARTMGMSAERIAKAMGHRRLQTQETYSKLSSANAIRGWSEPDL